jgi:dipeptidyl aminopeptidase/acylaminoacyl peptidase
VYLGSLESADHPVLIEDAGNARYANGYIFFLRETTLFAQRFDPGRRTLSGSPMIVAERIRINTGSGAGTFSVSPAGVLAYVTNRSTVSRLTWFDRGGREVGTLGEPGAFWNLHLSRDGGWVTASLGPSEDARDIWLFDTHRGIRTRVTRDDADEADPAVSPDGRAIAFSTRSGNAKRVDVKAVTGTAPAVRVIEDNRNKNPQDWSPDGQHVLYAHFSGGASSFDLWTVPASGGAPTALVQTNALELRAAFSPDGKWVAYETNESGRFEVAITPFPTGGPGRPVTSSGGANPHWGPDGRELFFLNGSMLMRAAVTTTSSGLEVGSAEPLFDMTQRIGELPPLNTSNVYSVSPDGQRFLFAIPQRQAPETISLVVNWPAALREQGATTK